MPLKEGTKDNHRRRRRPDGERITFEWRLFKFRRSTTPYTLSKRSLAEEKKVIQQYTHLNHNNAQQRQER